MNFFYAEESSSRYDADAPSTSESYAQAHALLIRILTISVKKILRDCPSKTICVIDLGCGTGVNVDQILAISPRIHYHGLDLSTQMLSLFRSKYRDIISKNGNNPARIFLQNGDVRSKSDLRSLFRDKNDVEFIVISAFLFHHFTYNEKIDIYSVIRENIGHKSQFIQLDLFSHTNDWALNLALNQELSWIETCFENQISSTSNANLSTELASEMEKWVTHIRQENIPLPISGGKDSHTEFNALLSAGFTSASCFFRHFQTGIIMAITE